MPDIRIIVRDAPYIYLASASPRRHALLEQIGVRFQVLDVEVDETVGCEEPAGDYVTRLARAKAAAGLFDISGSMRERAPVLAADTAVILDRCILGKPRDRRDALRMLSLLSGRTHAVLTGVALADAGGMQSCISRSEVSLRVITAQEAAAYWETGEPIDKAGAYAIQGRAAVFVADLRGSYSGVMGLPLYETAMLLDSAGVDRRRGARSALP